MQAQAPYISRIQYQGGRVTIRIDSLDESIHETDLKLVTTFQFTSLCLKYEKLKAVQL